MANGQEKFSCKVLNMGNLSKLFFVKRKGKLLSVEYEKPIMLIQDIFLASYNLKKDIYENVFNLANLEISWAKEKYQNGKLAESNNG